MIRSISAATPSMCTGMIAFVRSVILRSRSSGSMFSVSSTLTITGTAPASAIASAVAMNVNDWVMTSSPRPTPSAASPTRSAAVPDDTAIACGTPSQSATLASNSRTR